MGANVVTDEEAFSDVRFEILAGLCGFADADHARSKMERVWLWCVKHETDLVPVAVLAAVLQQPTSSIQQLLGPLDQQGCDLGEAAGDGLVRVKGCDQHRTFWYKTTKRQDKSAGGKARTASATRGASGRFQQAAGLLDQQFTSSSPASVQHPTDPLDQHPPAAPATDSDSEISEHTPRARSVGYGLDQAAVVVNELRVARADVVRRLQAVDGISAGPGSGMGIGGSGEADATRMVAAFFARTPDPGDPAGESPPDRARRLGRYVLSCLEAQCRRDRDTASLRESVCFGPKVVDWALNTTPAKVAADRPRQERGRQPAKPAVPAGPPRLKTYVPPPAPDPATVVSAEEMREAFAAARRSG